MSPFSTKQSPTGSSGFALVIAISLMAFILLLILGLTATLRVETTVSNQTVQMAKAQENAKTALMVALAELQKSAGPDQRVTAWSDILDTTPEDSGTIQGVSPNAQKMLGVWESWTSYITDPMTTDAATSGVTINNINNTYTRGRSEDLFQRWLVSHSTDNSNSPLTSELDSVYPGGIDFTDIDTTVEMVADGTLGTNTIPTDYVRAGKVTINGTTTNQSGAYAWWIGGDNLKAALSPATDEAAKQAIESDFGPSFRADQLNSNSLGQIDPRGDTALSSFDDTLREKISTQAALLNATSTGDVDAINGRYFDYTPYSESLLVDVRRGGVKRDINLLFESDQPIPSGDAAKLNSRFGRYQSGDIIVDAPIRSVEGAVASEAGSLENPHIYPPSWRNMIEYYRLYRSASDYGVQWDGNTPYTFRMTGVVENSGEPREGFNYRRSPVITRFSHLFGLRRDADPSDSNKHNLVIVWVPVLTLWNPYNTELRMESEEVQSFIEFAHAIRFQATIVDSDTGANLFSGQWEGLNNLIGKAGQNNNLRKRLKTIPFVGGNNDDDPGNDIHLAPGEMVTFSVTELGNNGDSSVLEKGFIRGQETGIELSRLGMVGVDSTKNYTIGLRLGGEDKGQRITDYGLHHASMFAGLDQSIGTSRQYKADGSTTTGRPLITFGVNWFGENPPSNFNSYQVDFLPISEGVRFPSIPSVSGSQNDIEIAAIVDFIAKTGEEILHSSGDPDPNDYRGRIWLHSPLQINHILGKPNAQTKVEFPFVLDTDILAGSSFNFTNAVAVDTDSDQTYGRAYGGPSNSSVSGFSQIITQELPTAPITSLAGFATMPLKPAAVIQMSGTDNHTTAGGYWRSISHRSASFGVGIGNGFAHPFLPENQFFHKYTGSDWTHYGNTDKNYSNSEFSSNVWNDYWDQLLITNDALWDEWFCSGIVPTSSKDSEQTDIDTVAKEFLENQRTLANQHLKVNSPETVSTQDAIDNTTDDATGHERVAAFMKLEGGFNVNSTSIEAWRALLYGLKQRKIPYIDAIDGSTGTLSNSNVAYTSRHSLAAASQEGTDPFDPYAWLGVRALTDLQLDKLAEEIVEQVKRRGPFLSMSEFINRRMGDTNDERLNQTGMLQAAIDWDEFDNDYDGASVGSNNESINSGFKDNANMMISTPNATFENDTVARGSVYTAIPGYLVASDLLQAFGGIFTPRDDTFTIRAYGETTDLQGNVIRAWCEAKVQRQIDFMDASDSPWESKADRLGNNIANTTDLDNGVGLSDINRKFGRKLKIVSFRWLNKDEV